MGIMLMPLVQTHSAADNSLPSKTHLFSGKCHTCSPLFGVSFCLWVLGSFVPVPSRDLAQHPPSLPEAGSRTVWKRHLGCGGNTSTADSQRGGHRGSIPLAAPVSALGPGQLVSGSSTPGSHHLQAPKPSQVRTWLQFGGVFAPVPTLSAKKELFSSPSSDW